MRDACTTQLVTERIPGQYINKNGFIQLYERLHEFTSLQELSIYRHSNEGIVGADDIIEKCRNNLTSVSLFISPLPGYNTFEKFGSNVILSTRPRPEVNTVEALCDVTNYDDGLNYLMHKFPSPKYLRLWSFSSAGGFRAHDLYPSRLPSISADVMKRFFDYLHRIHSFSVECTCEDTNMLIDFMMKNKNRIQKKIILEYNLRQPNLEFVDNSTTKVRFSPKVDMTIMPHTKFFEGAGRLIRYLSVFQIEAVQSHLSILNQSNPAIRTMVVGQWFLHLLENCPHLIELTMKGMGQFHFHYDDNQDSFITNNKQHMSLEKLTIYMHSILRPSVLNNLSWLLPCLRHVHFVFYWRFYGSNTSILPGTVNINMPHTAFDTLTLEKYTKTLVSNNFIFYIKVTTGNSDSLFYVTGTEKARRCTNHCYNKATKAAAAHLAFDIKCKSIKTLHLIYGLNFIGKYSLNIESS
jgi:hypothetical protein